MALTDRTARFFTEAARAAGIAKRRENASKLKETSHVLVFVVRSTDIGKPFGWEVRKFGGIVLSRSGEGFGSQSEAQAAGEKALAVL